jgi:hypothetical protein
MKRAKLQYAIKSSTRLNDGEQCLGGAFNHRCKTSPLSPIRTNKDPHCHAQHAAITLRQLKQLSSISTNLSNSPPPLSPKKCREELKMKSDIDLHHNCDQSMTVWWSTWSSARHWWGRERRPTMNKSKDNTKEPA